MEVVFCKLHNDSLQDNGIQEKAWKRWDERTGIKFIATAGDSYKRYNHWKYIQERATLLDISGLQGQGNGSIQKSTELVYKRSGQNNAKRIWINGIGAFGPV